MFSYETNYDDFTKNYHKTAIQSGEYPALAALFNSPLWKKYPSMFIKGGAARTVFLNHVKERVGVTPDKHMNVRDVDLLVFTGSECDDSESMKDRVRADVGNDPRLKGADVEFIDDDLSPESVTNYLDSRDTEGNRAMVRPGVLVYSTDAESFLMDELVSTGSAYSREWRYDMDDDEPCISRDYPLYSSRVALRAILQALKEGLEIPPEEYWKANDAGEFNLALHLVKAFQDNTEDAFVKLLYPAFHRFGYMESKETEPELVLARMYRYYMMDVDFTIDGIEPIIDRCLKYERQHDLLQRTDLSRFEGCSASASGKLHENFVDYVAKLGLESSVLECISAIHKACFEQIAFDVNAKPNPESPISWRHTGQINRLPSLVGKKRVGYGNFKSEWFPDSGVATKDPVVRRLIGSSEDAQMGCRSGTWGGPGRTVLGKRSALSNENVCADTSTPQS